MVFSSVRSLGGRALAPVMLAVFIVALSTPTSCGRASTTSGNVDIGLQLLTEKAVGLATVEITVRTPEGKPIDGAQLSLRGDMNHAGMVPVLVQPKPAGSGRYLAEDFRFTMGGDWILTVQATLPDGERVEQSFNVNGVAGR
jgi:hypothetical protein